MVSALATQAPDSAATSKIALSEFRLGDNHMSDASDSDQSEGGERSLSPSRQGVGKTRKKKDRRRFGALAEELGDLLGSAFNPDDSNSAAAGTGAGAGTLQVDNDVTMDVEPTPSGKKMNKRTRQNLKRMEARQQREKMQTDARNQVNTPCKTTTADRGGIVKKNKQMSATEKRRAREREARIRKAVEAGDRMNIE